MSGSAIWLIRNNIDREISMLCTFKTGVVMAVSTWHIIPSVTMLGSKSVNTVFVFPIVRLLWGPGARFSKVPIINGPGKLSPFTLKIEVLIVLHLA